MNKIFFAFVCLMLTSCVTTKKEIEYIELPAKIVVETRYEKCYIDRELFKKIKIDIDKEISRIDLDIKMIEIIKEYESRLNIISKSVCLAK